MSINTEIGEVWWYWPDGLQWQSCTRPDDSPSSRRVDCQDCQPVFHQYKCWVTGLNRRYVRKPGSRFWCHRNNKHSKITFSSLFNLINIDCPFQFYPPRVNHFDTNWRAALKQWYTQAVHCKLKVLGVWCFQPGGTQLYNIVRLWRCSCRIKLITDSSLITVRALE